MKNFEGKTVLITGAGSGIGRAVAQLFAKEGAKVLAVDINEDSVQETVKDLPEEGHEWFVTDVTNSSEVSDLFAKVKASYEKQAPTIFILCAGVVNASSIIDTDEEEYDRQVSVNLKGTFLMMKESAKSLIESDVKDGSIVTFSSLAAHESLPCLAPYSAAKAGVLCLTKAAAKEWASIPIRCNAVLPGLIETPMLYLAPKEILDSMIPRIPMGRIGTAAEIAEVCLFLASGKSSYITGAGIDVNGGMP